MTDRDFKYFPRRKAYDKLVRDNAFNIAKNVKYDDINGLQFFDKTSSGDSIKSEIISNQSFGLSYTTNKRMHISQLSVNLKNKKFIHFLKTIFGCWSSKI